MRPRDLAERDADRLGRYGRRDQAPLEPRLDEARARLGSDGRIRIVTGGAAPWWHVLVRQYADVLIAILGAAAAISFAIGETVDAAAILAILLLNGPLGFAQEWRAERAIAALARMLVQRATVVRDGREQEVDAEELVAGDSSCSPVRTRWRTCGRSVGRSRPSGNPRPRFAAPAWGPLRSFGTTWWVTVERTVQFQDYYKTLGVERSASADEIKRAYRKLAMKHHPDRAGEGEREAAEALFKRINEAYEVLSDPEKRAKYDRFGERWRQGQEFTPPGREDGGRRMSREEMEEMFGSFGFSDFFAQMFGDDLRQQYAGGARRHTRYRHRGADVRAELVLSATQAVHGGTSAFEIPAAAACAQCGGVGFVEEHVCPTCGGVGSVRRARTVELKIPEDVRDGQVLRLRGLGEAGFEGGASGDLLLSLRIASDGAYRVAGDDLETDVEVAPWDAFVGTRAGVRTPQGTAHVTVPPESRSGAKLRLRGQGLADGRGGRGDLIAVVRHALPARLTARQQELLRELAGSDAEAKA